MEQRQSELRELPVRALEVLAEAWPADRAGTEAVEDASAPVSLDPYRDSAYRQSTAAHALTGSRARAVQVYVQCRRIAEELGVRPSPATAAAYTALIEDLGPPSLPA